MLLTFGNMGRYREYLTHSIVKRIDDLTYLVAPCPVSMFHNIHGVEEALQLVVVMKMIRMVIKRSTFKMKMEMKMIYLYFCVVTYRRWLMHLKSMRNYSVSGNHVSRLLNILSKHLTRMIRTYSDSWKQQ